LPRLLVLVLIFLFLLLLVVVVVVVDIVVDIVVLAEGITGASVCVSPNAMADASGNVM